jgi:rSAM/selenodomain-associated transferase 2
MEKASAPGLRISVIVPCLDEAAHIVRALEALAPLRSRGHEVIVADGGSSDATPELARPLADRVVAAPRGRALQMNAGAALASGEVLLFVHADTLLPQGADEAVRAALARCGRHWGRFDVRIEGGEALLALVSRLMNLRSRATGIATGDQAIFVRRAVFERIGGFPELPLMEDIALCKRLKTASRPLCLAEVAVTSGRRWRERGVLRTIALMWWLRLQFFFGAAPARLARSYHGRS